jgi:hypothetical protein
MTAKAAPRLWQPDIERVTVRTPCGSVVGRRQQPVSRCSAPAPLDVGASA